MVFTSSTGHGRSQLSQVIATVCESLSAAFNVAVTAHPVRRPEVAGHRSASTSIFSASSLGAKRLAKEKSLQRSDSVPVYEFLRSAPLAHPADESGAGADRTAGTLT